MIARDVICPVCANRARQLEPTAGDFSAYECETCGSFCLSGTLWSTLPDKLKKSPDSRSLLSFAIRSMQRGTSSPLLTTQSINDILAHTSLPGVSEQVDRLLLKLGETTKRPGRSVVISSEDQSTIGADSPQGLELILEYLADQGLLQLPKKDTVFEGYNGGAVRLTTQGWMRYEQLKRGHTTSRTAFMAMKFGDPVLDLVLETCFRPAVEATGFVLRRLDEGQGAGLIDAQMEVRLRVSKFVLVDLSHGNAGAYWEAGFGSGLGKPVIYTCKTSAFHDKDRRPHFDTNHHVTVLWDEENLGVASQQLRAIIRATLPHEAKLED